MGMMHCWRSISTKLECSTKSARSTRPAHDSGTHTSTRRLTSSIANTKRIGCAAYTPCIEITLGAVDVRLCKLGFCVVRQDQNAFTNNDFGSYLVAPRLIS